MEKKNNLLKNIFYIFFALCFFSIGVMTLNTKNENYVKAEDSSSITNTDLPTFFSAKEYIGDTENTSAVADTFLYFSEGGTSSTYKLSFLNNKDDDTVAHDIYKWVYYPDENDKSVFYYYYINSVGLSINGVTQNEAMSDFVEDSGLAFPQEATINLQSFDMIFTNKSSDDLEKNEISILDENGNVKEGIYQLSISYTLFTCTDGKADLSEQNIVPAGGKFNYEFYVLDKENYLSVDSANVSWNNFDHEVKTSTKFVGYSNLLYSNYSSKGSTDSMPYIEYDYTRYELEITNGIKTTSLEYDLEANKVITPTEGSLIDRIFVDENNKTCKVYFINTDKYDVTFKPIKVLGYQTEETAPIEKRKYSLENLQNNTKKVKVYVYGYQANYTDYDKPLDGNLMNQTSELKDFDTNSGKFLNGADITSKFLNSNEDYSQAKGSESFLIENIVNFIKTAGVPSKGEPTFLEPVKTNQSPIDLTTNANLYSKSYVYSTTKVSDAYTKVNGITLNGQTLYQSTFKGLVDSSEGKYIYIISYTYDNYYENEATLNKNQVFYQVFYFEIIKTVQKNIKVQTEDGTNLPTESYTNKNVQIIDENSNYPYNKDVRIQVYVQDYADNFLSEYGGIYGKEYNDGDLFTQNGKYTIRLFYENEVKDNSEKLSYNYTKGEKAYFNTRTFVIDKDEISNITARNVTKVLSTTDVATYKISSYLETFATNQSIVLSWDKKSSNANTYAYYRWFPLVDAQYYSTADANNVSKTISRMLSGTNENLPVNALLNLDTSKYDWDSYEGNTIDFSSTVSQEYVLDDPGLYIVDVYDEAGNHKIEVYFIDNTAPIFALEDVSTGLYSLTQSSMYVTQKSNLHWSKNKAIYMANFDSFWYNGFASVDDISESNLIKSSSTDDSGNITNTYYDLYTTYNDNASLEIFQKLYNTLYKNKYMQVLSCNISVDDSVDELIQSKGYTENYLTIPVDSTSFFMIRGMSSESPSYQKQSDVYSYEISVEKEFTYSVYLRDLSNTIKDLTISNDSMIQYTNYSSTNQTIRVSHDSSKFVIQYTPKGSSTPVDLFANSIVDGTTEDGHRTQTSYLSPTSLDTTFSISYKPTVKDNIVIQVESIVIRYYEYEQVTKKVGNTYYTFYRLSDSATEETIYSFPTNDESEDTLTYEIRPITNVTREGKYEITRTYYLGTADDNYDYNVETDYYQRTYVFYVDRNDVISPSSRVTDENGTHHESLVGGDIFVAMYDNQTSADLVVTFPNSEEGNTDGSNLNNSTNQNPVFTTNMLPVNVYVPQFKYTTFVQKLTNGSKYYYNVNFDYYYTTSDTTYLYDTSDCSTTDPASLATLNKDVCLNVIEVLKNENIKVKLDDGTIKYVSNSQYKVLKNQNYYDSGSLIAEYALFAEIYKNGTDASNMIAKTSKNYNDPQLQYLDSNNGFLNFYDSNNEKLNYLTDAGTYYVKIYQGRFGIEKGNANDYEQALTFCFEIKATEPDFEAQTNQNSPLYYEENTKTYYTNQPNVKLVWQPGSTFMAEIDIDQIKFETPSGSYVYGEDKDKLNIFLAEPSLSNGLWTATLDLEALKVYKNNAWVKVKMQYKNHNEDFYETVEKTIQVDLSAPNTNINKLIENSTNSNLIPTLTEKNLRTYYTAKEGEIASSPDTTCFNISSSTGNFKYYSYLVESSFLNTLKASSDLIYIKQFGDGEKYNNNYTQETAPSDFLASNYTEISMFAGFEAGNYYEVVESDKAGNLTIYTVYVVDYTKEQTLITMTNADSETREYTANDYQKVLSYAGSNHTLYALTGFELESINYFGDAWAEFTITTRNSSTSLPVTRTLMLTPWDDERAYAFDNSGNATAIYLRDLVNASKNVVFKDVISVYDRITTENTNFYINIQSTQFNSTLTTDQNAEYITFNMPAKEQIQSTTYATTYLTELKITAKLDSGDVILFDATGDNANSLGYADIWQSLATDDVLVDYMSTTSQIRFALSTALNLSASTKITYEYKDNFGRSYKKIHLYNEPIILTEIMSEKDLYSYYTDNGKLFYITEDGFKYLYNPAKVEIKVFELNELTDSEEGVIVSKKVGDGVTASQKAIYENDVLDNSTKISTYTVRFNPNQKQAAEDVEVLNYNDSYVLKVYDLETGKKISKVYFKLYNEITQSSEVYADGSLHNAYAGNFKLLDANGNDITTKIITPADEDNLGYFSEVRLIYNTIDTFIPVKFSVSKDLTNWEEVNSGTRFKCQTDNMEKYYLKIWYDEAYLENEMGNPAYAFSNVPETQIFEFNLSSLTATYWVEKTVNGLTEIVTKDSSMFVAQDGTQYSNHYIVNVDYTNKYAVEIKTNEELGIRAFENPGETYSYGSTVKSQVYTITNTKDANGNYNSNLGNIPAFETVIVITYIPSSENFVDEFYTYNMNGVIDKTVNLIRSTSASVVISNDSKSLDSIELQWSKYYGFTQNEINITLVKDGIEINPIVYSKLEDGKMYNYINLSHSGKYQIYLKDKAGNVQKFNYGMVGQSDYLNFIFLKDVPFTITYTNPETGLQETSTPIKQAVYNGSVTLNIDKNTRSEFYSSGGYPTLSVLRNGVEYTNFTSKDEVAFTFTETGFYQVTFEATSNIPNKGTIRQESYEFTILDPDEYKYSYIFNSYANYYVEKVVKDGKDITQSLVKSLDVETVLINNVEYIKELPLSYLDEKTGAGSYMITINTNDKFYANSDFITKWTYQVKIKVGSAPIKISLAEGEETTGLISFTLNKANVYSEMGSCYVRVVSYVNNTPVIYTSGSEIYNFEINSESIGQLSKEINKTGTYYIQIVSTGNNLLYSYKVVRNEPMNAATIIAIIISAVVAVLVGFIIFKLRKRISVK